MAHSSRRHCQGHRMTPTQLKAWRKHLGYSQQAAAYLLGISVSSVKIYERGKRWDGRSAEIPLTVELACAALALGITHYSGPTS